MDIWGDSPHAILSLLLSSTAHKFYFSEILDGTGLAPGTVSSNLRRLRRADVVFRRKERFNFDHPNRAARVFYTVNPLLIDYLRLHAPST
jgi:DNA-binding transcriptional ArsR family regulator